jgi:hypothetical protein
MVLSEKLKTTIQKILTTKNDAGALIFADASTDYSSPENAIASLDKTTPADKYKTFWEKVIQTAGEELVCLEVKELDNLSKIKNLDANAKAVVLSIITTKTNPPLPPQPTETYQSQTIETSGGGIINLDADDLDSNKIKSIPKYGMDQKTLNDYFIKSRAPNAIRTFDNVLDLQEKFRLYYLKPEQYLMKREALYKSERNKLIAEYNNLISDFVKNGVLYEDAQKIADEVTTGKMKAVLASIEKQFPTDFSAIPGFDIFLRNQRVSKQNN